MPTSRAPTIAAPFQNWRTVLSSVLWSGLTVIALVLISRKLSGAFSRELSATAACFSATLAVLVSFTAALQHHADRQRSDGRIRAGVSAESSLMAMMTLTSPLLIAVALLPGHSLAATFYTGGLFLSLLTGVVLLLTDSHFLRRKPTTIRPAEISSVEFPSAAVTGIAWPPVDSLSSTSGAADEVPHGEESVLQRFTRTTTPTGTERISGSISVCFAAGQRQATVHLPFVPPLAVLPTVVCDVPDESAVRLKVAAVHPYGTRIELKRLAGSETAETIEIGFTVTADAARTTAA